MDPNVQVLQYEETAYTASGMAWRIYPTWKIAEIIPRHRRQHVLYRVVLKNPGNRQMDFQQRRYIQADLQNSLY